MSPRVASLLAQLTPAEKIAQLSGVLFPWGEENFPFRVAADGRVIESPEFTQAAEHGLGFVGNVNFSLCVERQAVILNAIQRRMLERARVPIPVLVFDEAGHGHLAQDATLGPLPPGLAATFDPERVEQLFRAIGREARVRGGHLAFCPVAEVTRDPRWGRAGECFSEDPLLAGRMAAAVVRGLQGSATGEIAPDGVGATLKHFAGYAQSDGGRQFAPASLGPRQLRDEVLRSFLLGLAARPAAVMPSYGETDGLPCHANRWLLRDLLRSEWGFTGLVVSDYDGCVRNTTFHHCAPDHVGAGALALQAGVDLDTPSGNAYRPLVPLLGSRPDLMLEIDAAVARLLGYKERLGLFEDPYVKVERARSVVHCAEHRAVVAGIDPFSVVLVQNEAGFLPLAPAGLRRVAVVGPHAQYIQLGDYSPHNRAVSILDGLRARLPGVEVVFAQGCNLLDRDLAQVREGLADAGFGTLAAVQPGDKPRSLPLELERPLLSAAADAARQADLCVVCLGESPSAVGENFAATRYGDRTELGLIGNQLALLDALRDTGTPLVVVLIHNRLLAYGPVLPGVRAVLDAFNGAETRGETVAAVLFGDREPGGRLPATVPLHAGAVPVHYGQKPTGWLRDYALLDGRHLFPFGFGLGYTTWELTSLRSPSPLRYRAGDPAPRCLAGVRNTGARAGSTVVQLYVEPPPGPVTRAPRLLAGFARASAAPGAATEVEIVLEPEILRRTGIDLRPELPAGDYRLVAAFDASGTGPALHLTVLP